MRVALELSIGELESVVLIRSSLSVERFERNFQRVLKMYKVRDFWKLTTLWDVLREASGTGWAECTDYSERPDYVVRIDIADFDNDFSLVRVDDGNDTNDCAFLDDVIGPDNIVSRVVCDAFVDYVNSSRKRRPA